MAELEPPSKTTEMVDPGARDLDSSQASADAIMEGSEENPTVHVESTADDPKDGSESNPTMTTSQTHPDDMDMTGAQPTSTDSKSTPELPGGLQIPKTVVEKVDPESPSYGEEPGTAAHNMRKADAEPDEVRTAPEISRIDLEGLPTSSINRYSVPSQSDDPVEEDMPEPRDEPEDAPDTPDFPESGKGVSEEVTINASTEDEIDVPAGDEDFGDDFDDFEEGAEDDDFGGFDEPSINPQSLDPPSNMSFPSQNASQSVPLPNLNFASLHSLDDIVAACQPYLDEMRPDTSKNDGAHMQLPEINTSFLTERSQSLWAQLVAPPPLQPPDWIRSRIRRLFLVSLGVPVDLDEILPASKQKKLVLPSMHVDGDQSPYRRGSTPLNGAAAKTKDESNPTANPSTPGAKLERRRTGALPPPELDLQSTRYLCSTTEVALRNLSHEELQDHVAQLESLTQRAKELLEYWQGQRESATGNQKAFEEVIENLVKHAQKIRK